MVTFNALVVVSLAYVILLFAVAFWAERRAATGQDAWLRSPWIYTLSLSVYCTAWTFYGAVGFAARSGLEFLTIYLGPTLVMLGWWVILRKMVRIGRAQRVTSIADMVSGRFGKSTQIAGLVTILAVLGTTPYIALQLQSVTLSYSVFLGQANTDLNQTSLWVAVGLALFTVIFGTRSIDVNERHHGVVMAIAVEAVVKFCALVAVGIFVVWGLGGGPAAMTEAINASTISDWEVQPSRWMGLTFLSAAAFLCLPRMFQVLVVENSDEKHLATASWAFPAYLAGMSLFVVPIAVVGLDRLPVGSNPDLFVLTLPLAEGQNTLAMFAFLGGFSSATSMVIVAAIALSTMVSNHIVMPLWLRSQPEGAVVSGDVRRVLLMSRRLSIIAVLALGYIYFRLSGGGAALAAIGLISFVGVAQVLPALLGGLFWRGATRAGAAAGLVIGFVVWAYTLFLPSVAAQAAGMERLLADGAFGIGWLRPRALFGVEGLAPVIHALFWSMLLNSTAVLVGSLLSRPEPMERLQGAQYVNAFGIGSGSQPWQSKTAEAEDLLMMAQRILGGTHAQALFATEASAQGYGGYLPDVTPSFLERLERELAGSVGAATAHAMVAQTVGGAAVTVQELLAVADETQQMLEYSSQLEAKSAELTRTARQLRAANDKLTALSVQKDAFLSQISHELRTPMTSIRSFSELLRDGEIEPDDQARFADTIHAEAKRLTRLLDDLLDLSVLENGQVALHVQRGTLSDVLDRAVAAAAIGSDLEIRRRKSQEGFELNTDLDRLTQVFINLIANAAKYCDAHPPVLRISVARVGGGLRIDFVDNGPGIPTASQPMIFEKFYRTSDQQAAGGAGLGLAICREVMINLGGHISYLPGQGGAAFRVILPAESLNTADVAAQ